MKVPVIFQREAALDFGMDRVFSAVSALEGDLRDARHAEGQRHGDHADVGGPERHGGARGVVELAPGQQRHGVGDDGQKVAKAHGFVSEPSTSELSSETSSP